jgi:hypothetical protein
MTSFHYLTLDEKIALIRDQGCHLMKSKKRKIRKKAENSSKNSKKAEREIEKWKKSGNLYFYEILRFLRVLTIYFSICSISLFF